MMDAVDASLRGLEPTTLWQQFDALRKIPRASLNEEGVRRYLRGLSDVQGWQCLEDGAGNCVVKVPGRGRGVKSPPLAIQGHMDMICEKLGSVEHDFAKDPISLQRTTRTIDGVERQVLMAQGTTLGADNGIGVCTALALALEPGLDHPPLELVMTADEETGMTGAANLDGTLVTARRLINLDAEEQGSIYLSCAGGRDFTARWLVEREAVGHDDQPLRIIVGGLKGGHSGVDIHLKRGNAIKLLLEILSDPRVELDGVRVASFDGGGRDNVIPRSADLRLWCVRTRVRALKEKIAEVAKTVAEGLGPADSGFFVRVEGLDAKECPLPLESSTMRCIMKVMGKIPDGVLAWSQVIDGLVETSTNLGVVETLAGELRIVSLTRSSKAGAIEAVQERMERAVEAAGGTVEFCGGYPGWEADTGGSLLKQAVASYERLFAAKPALKAIHAGLECGILGDRIPGAEMISVGPELRNVHTPDEALVLDSVGPYWTFVSNLVRDLCEARDNRPEQSLAGTAGRAR